MLASMTRDRLDRAYMTMPCRQALFDEAQFERLQGVPDTTIHIQIGRLWQQRQRWLEPVYHDFGPGYVLGGEIYAGGERIWIPTNQTPMLSASVEVMDEPIVITNSSAGMRYFGHWVLDDCSAFAAARDEGRGRLVSMVRRNWPDIPLFEEAFFNERWVEKKAVWSPRVQVTTDMGFSPAKRDRLESFRNGLRTRITATDPGKIVYLRRGPSAVSRDVTNEDELISALEAKGIPIVRAEIDTPEMLAQLMDSKVVITVEGSQTTHATWTVAKSGALLVLQPPDRFYNPHLEWTRLFDIPYGVVIGEPREGGFHIYPDEVFSMIDRLLKA